MYDIATGEITKRWNKMAGSDPEKVIRFLKDNGFMGKPEDSPWPRFDPETMERKPLDLHRFMTDDKYLEEVMGISFDSEVE